MRYSAVPVKTTTVLSTVRRISSDRSGLMSGNTKKRACPGWNRLVSVRDITRRVRAREANSTTACGANRDGAEFVDSLYVGNRAVDELCSCGIAAPEHSPEFDVVDVRDCEYRRAAVATTDSGGDEVLTELDDI